MAINERGRILNRRPETVAFRKFEKLCRKGSHLGVLMNLPIADESAPQLLDALCRLLVMQNPVQHLAHPTELAALRTRPCSLDGEVRKRERAEPGTFRFHGVVAAQGVLKAMELGPKMEQLHARWELSPPFDGYRLVLHSRSGR